MWRLILSLFGIDEAVEDAEEPEEERGYELPDADNEKKKDQQNLEKPAPDIYTPYAANDNYDLPKIEDETLEEEVEEFPEPKFASDEPGVYEKEGESELERDVEEEKYDVSEERQRFMQKLADKQYEAQQKEKEPYQQQIANDNQKSGWDRLKTAARNIPNIAKDVVYTLGPGYAIAKRHNKETIEALKENPDIPVKEFVHGSLQNAGSMVPTANEWRKRGYLVWHHFGINHGRETEENVDRIFENKNEMYREANLYREPEEEGSDAENVLQFRTDEYSRVPTKEELSRRSDSLWGHSSGAEVAKAAKRDSRAVEYGYTNDGVYQLAGPGTIHPKTAAQKGILMIAPKDDARRPESRKGEVERESGTPQVSSHAYAFSNDGLVNPQYTVDRSAGGHTVIDHPHATHFGSVMNKDVINMVIDHYEELQRSKGRDPKTAKGYDMDYAA